MAILISSYFGANPETLKSLGVFDAVIGIDTRLFLDPHLLKKTKVPEFKNSRRKIEKYYSDIIRLLLASKINGDVAWRQALQRLTFKEIHGVSMGYGVHSGDGNAIGTTLASRLIGTASEIIEMGIKDPEIFELLGLFEEDFGADRLSDMTIVIIKDDIYRYTQRIANTLNIKSIIEVKSNDIVYNLPKHPYRSEPLLLLPMVLLRDLPVALTWDGIDHVVATNQELRDRLNELIGLTWKNKITKRQLRDFIFTNKENIETLLSAYKGSSASYYDFENDPAGEVVWYRIGKEFAEHSPLSLQLRPDATIEELERIIKEIIYQFKKLIEVNGLEEHLYTKVGSEFKPRHERFSQRLFYAVADSYCKANNLDISREPDAGSGPVDFKLSRGYTNRVLVELKLSSNSRLINGYRRQLPAYQESENTKRSFYVVLKVTKSDKQIKELIELESKIVRGGKKAPKVIVIDAEPKPSASKR